MIAGIGALICAAALTLHVASVAAPLLFGDDFQILRTSWTWRSTWDHVLEPHNEHTMPLGRVSTWLLCQAAGRVTMVPLAGALQGPLAVLLGMILVYFFVSREIGHPFYGLVAMAFFGITTQYVEAVYWFSASFGILALDTLLLGLLAAQAWRQTGRWPHLVGAGLAAALAPGWFATGILAGPLMALYLVVPDRSDMLPAGRAMNRWLAALAPVAGTALFLAVVVPRNAETINHLEHYGEATARNAIKPTVGLRYTARSLVDNLGMGTLGISGVRCEEWLVPLPLGLLAVLAMLWAWKGPHLRMMLLGLALILLSYFLIYSARAAWSYEQVSSWGRYQLWSHLGLTLFLVGGLPRWHRWFLSWPPLTGTAIAMVLMLSLLFAQLPRSRALQDNGWERQELARVERVDARCREFHIAADRAREALPTFWLYEAYVSGWEFLRGSDTPEPHPDDTEVRQKLGEAAKD
jgi:hypothetical protein